MFIKQIGLCIVGVIAFLNAFGQDLSVYRVTEHIGKARLHIETSAIRYRNATPSNYVGFGFGVGGEFYFLERKKSMFSLAPTFHYNQASEEQKTYSVENNSYYYRSTTLTGRMLFAPAFYYKRNIGKQIQLGLGFQPQFVIGTLKDFYTYGESVSAIPDVEFRKTEVAILASLTYVISPLYSVNLVGQFGSSPVTQSIESVYADGLRMQISKRIY